MSNWLIRLLLIEYIVIMSVCILEKNFVKAIYWLGASIITTSVILGFK